MFSPKGTKFRDCVLKKKKYQKPDSQTNLDCFIFLNLKYSVYQIWNRSSYTLVELTKIYFTVNLNFRRKKNKLRQWAGKAG